VYGPPGYFKTQSGQRSQIRQTFMGFNHQYVWGAVKSLGPVPLLALTSGAYGRPETASPRQIATGRLDGFLYSLNDAINRWPGQRFYLRPFPEMNAYWENICAYNSNGTRRNAAHSTAWTRKAFARIAIIARGGIHLTLLQSGDTALCRLVDEPRSARHERARLALTAAVQAVLATGLGYLGIGAPDWM